MDLLGQGMGQFLPLILIFGVFYFLLIRPQQKRVKEQKEMLSQLNRGDRIVTTGGLLGTITKVVNEAELEVEIADGVKVRIVRSMVASVVPTTGVATGITKSDSTTTTTVETKKPRTTTAKKTTKTANKA